MPSHKQHQELGGLPRQHQDRLLVLTTHSGTWIHSSRKMEFLRDLLVPLDSRGMCRLDLVDEVLAGLGNCFRVESSWYCALTR